jgi:hypothetical protein
MTLRRTDPAPFHSGERRRPYFEGWYFKQASEDTSFAAIPGVFLGGDADTAFVQLIFGAPPQSFFIRYPISEFRCAPRRFEITIGSNFFSMDRVLLDIGEIGLTAELAYTGHVSLKTSLCSPTIMGPFAYLPGMQCSHGVLSLHHRVNGVVELGGRRIEFRDADGYIEKDWGREFPQSWVWMQANRPGAALMCAIASIPYAGVKFTGLICTLQCGGTQYRFATYNGAKTLRVAADGGRVEAELARCAWRLRVFAQSEAMGVLMAPAPTGMTREIAESITARCDVLLTRRGSVVYEDRFENGGLEMLNPEALTLRARE